MPLNAGDAGDLAAVLGALKHAPLDSRRATLDEARRLLVGEPPVDQRPESADWGKIAHDFQTEAFRAQNVTALRGPDPVVVNVHVHYDGVRVATAEELRTRDHRTGVPI